MAALAATTLAVGGDRRSSRLLWQQLLESSDTEWLRGNAEFRLKQLDAMDLIDALSAAAEKYAAKAAAERAEAERSMASPETCGRHSSASWQRRVCGGCRQA